MLSPKPKAEVDNKTRSVKNGHRCCSNGVIWKGLHLSIFFSFFRQVSVLPPPCCRTRRLENSQRCLLSLVVETNIRSKDLNA